ncbi:MAG TPA: hypothetical protein VMF67_00875 [Rhizomicrobium sp.]|nr:hypothetical protein [Rhizomicrobium sp.]
MTDALEQHREPPTARDAPAVIHLPPPAGTGRAKKARSGSEKRQRRAGILVKLTPTDHQRVKDAAAAVGMSAAGYLASGRLGEETAIRPRARRRPVDEPALMRALAAFNRASNNLNQLARTGNTLTLFAEEHGAGRLLDEAKEIARAARLLQEQFAAPIAAIMAALGRDREG